MTVGITFVVVPKGGLSSAAVGGRPSAESLSVTTGTPSKVVTPPGF